MEEQARLLLSSLTMAIETDEGKELSHCIIIKAFKIGGLFPLPENSSRHSPTDYVSDTHL